MSKVSKCASCHIVIDEMLAYVQNKLSVIDEDTLVRICSSVFSSEEIERSKELLFESIPVEKAKIKRKNKGKEQRNLVDIVSVFKSVEPDLFPIFVAKNLERLPPILFDHLDCTKLLKDILQLQNDLKEVKETYVTQVQLGEVKADILKTQNDSLVPASVCKINRKRGGWLLDSGPIGLSHIQDSSLDDCINIVDNSTLNNTPCFRNIKTVDGQIIERNVTATMTQLTQSTGKRPPPHVTHVTANTGPILADQPRPQPTVTSPRRVTAPAPSPTHRQSLSAVMMSNIKCVNKERSNENMSAYKSKPARRDDGEGWQKVSHRKRHNNYRYQGSAGVARDSEGNFKAAIKKVPIFITKVHKDTTEKDITEYIYQKMKEVIKLEQIVFKNPADYNAFKFFVPESKLSLFLNKTIWPEGIIFRRFVNFKFRKSNASDVSKGSVSGS
jgi:hypothetical protein